MNDHENTIIMETLVKSNQKLHDFTIEQLACIFNQRNGLNDSKMILLYELEMYVEKTVEFDPSTFDKPKKKKKKKKKVKYLPVNTLYNLSKEDYIKKQLGNAARGLAKGVNGLGEDISQAPHVKYMASTEKYAGMRWDKYLLEHN